MPQEKADPSLSEHQLLSRQLPLNIDTNIVLNHYPLTRNNTPRAYKEAAASTAAAPLKTLLLVITTSTGYFHSINLAQPIPTH